MKVSKKVIPYAVMTSLATAAVVAPGALAASETIPAGFYIEQDGESLHYTVAEFADLDDNEKFLLIRSESFVFVEYGTNQAATWAQISEAQNVMAALQPYTPGLIKEGNFKRADGTELSFQEPVLDEPTDVTTGEPTDVVTGEPTDVVTGEPTDVVTGEPTDVTTGEPVVDLAVESVSAINLRQLEVKFNTAVNRASAQNTDSYVGLGTVSVASLSEDGKTVILTLQTALSNNTERTLTIRNVQDLNGKAVEQTSKTFKALDTTIPTVKSVTALGSRSIQVVFSEPVQHFATTTDSISGLTDVYANFRLNNNNVVTGDLVGITANNTGTTYTINFNSALPIGEHTFSIVQRSSVNSNQYLRDFADYNVAPRNFKIEVEEDTTVPAVESVVVNSQTSVTVTFSKDMNVGAGNTANFFWNLAGSHTDNSRQATGVRRVDSRTFEVQFNQLNRAMPKGDVYFFINNVRDFNNVAIQSNVASQTGVYRSVVNVEENAAPQVANVNSVNDTTLDVTFSSAMVDGTTGNGVRNTANYTIRNSNNEIVNISEITYNSTTNRARITTGALPEGQYSITVDGVRDVTNRLIADSVHAFNVTDTTAPTLHNDNPIEHTGERALIIRFSEAMKTGTHANSITNINNYRYNNQSLAEAKPGAQLTAIENGRAVLISWSEPTSVIQNNNTISVGYFQGSEARTVADIAGNLLSPTGAQTLNVGSGNQLGVTRIDIASADTILAIADETTLHLTLPNNQPSWGNVVASDFTVTSNTVTFSVSTVQVDPRNSRKLIINLGGSNKLTSNLTSTDLISVSTVAQNSRDIFGETILQSRQTPADKAVANNISPVLQQAIIVSSDTVRVQFDSAIQTLSALNNDIRVVQGDKTFTVTAANVFENRIVDLTLNAALDPTQNATVRTLSQGFLTATGTNNATIKANETGIASSAFGLVNMTINQDGTTNAGLSTGDSITLTFNQAIDFAGINSALGSAPSVNADVIVTSGDTGTININHGTWRLGTFTVGERFNNLTNSQAEGVKVNIAKVPGNNRQLKLTFSTPNGAIYDVATSNDTVTFRPQSNLRSAGGVLVNDRIIFSSNATFGTD